MKIALIALIIGGAATAGILLAKPFRKKDKSLKSKDTETTLVQKSAEVELYDDDGEEDSLDPLTTALVVDAVIDSVSEDETFRSGSPTVEHSDESGSNDSCSSDYGSSDDSSSDYSYSDYSSSDYGSSDCGSTDYGF